MIGSPEVTYSIVHARHSPITVTVTNPSHPSLTVPLIPILKAATVLVELAGVMTYIWILPV